MTDRCVLLIDDDESVTRLLAARLNALAGIEALAVHDANQGLAEARARQPALIVCDIDMGATAGSGGDIAYALRNDARTASIPIVFLSAIVTPDDMGEAAGGYFMISKRIGAAKIVAAIVGQLPA